MAKKARTLDTPFRPGESVILASEFDQISPGTQGRIQLANGLGAWRRYWVRFDNGAVRGQVSHDVLVRPDQMDAWQAAKQAQAEAALRSEQTASISADAAADGAGAGAGGVASRIPAVILERSKAAKARLLG